MVAMVASASGYGTLRRFLSVQDGIQASAVPGASVAVSSKQRASIKWLLSKAFNNRVPENLQEPFYRDHEDQEHLKPPICGGLASAELYCLALANMYSDPNYHSLNHWNILQTFARKGVHVLDPPDCALTETVLIQTNPLRMSAHMSVIEALMVLYAREVVTPDRVLAATQRFGVSAPLPTGSNVPHEDGILCWVNAACAALNKTEELQQQVPAVTSLEQLCDGAALAALVSFYCPEVFPRAGVRVRSGAAASVHDCLHNLRLVHDFCTAALPHHVFHMMPEDVAYMRGSMRQNLVAMLADLFNMLEVHPVKSVKYPGSAAEASNEHGVRHRRQLPPPPPAAIPHLRNDDAHLPPFAVIRSGSASGMRCSTPERRSSSPQREEFVVHRTRAVTTLASVARGRNDRDDDSGLECSQTAAGRPSKWAESREGSFAGRRSRRGSVSEDSQLTVENFGGSQDRLHFAGRNPEKELATVDNVRKISAPSGPLDTYNPPVRSSRQDIRGSINFLQDFTNGSDTTLKRQHSSDTTLKRQHSSDTINQTNFTHKGGGDGYHVNESNDHHLTEINRNGEQTGAQPQFKISESEQPDRRKTTTFAPTPANTTTWQQQFMQQDQLLNGEDLTDDASTLTGGQAMNAQLNNIRLKLEEKRRRIEQDKRSMEVEFSRQRQRLGQQAFLQAVTRGKGARTPADDDNKQAEQDMAEPPSQTVDNAVLEQYQQSIAKMNSSLQDIQSDIARLASQQNQIQQQQQAKQLFQQPQLQQQLQQQIQQQQLQQQQLQQQQLQQQQLQQQQLQQQLLQQQQIQQQQIQQQQMQQQMQLPQSPYQQQPQYQPNIPQLHSQFSSQHNVSRPPLGKFGSTPHIPQFQQYPEYQEYREYQEPTYREMEERSRQQFYLHDSPPPPQRRTWAQHAQAQHDSHDLRGWQIHQQNHQFQGQESPARTWRSPSPQAAPPAPAAPAPHTPPPERWQPQGFMLHDRPTQPFQINYNTTDRYQNGTETPREGNHLSYTVYSSQSPSASPQRRSKTPQRQSSVPEPRPVSLQQLANDDMQPQNISFIGNAEDTLRAGIDRLNISSGTRTYRIPSPTRPSLARDSFHRLEQEAETNEKGFYISFDNEQPKRPKPPLRAKKGSPRKENRSPDRSPEEGWSDRIPQPCDEEAFVVHRARDVGRDVTREEDKPTPPRERPPRPTSAEPTAIVIGDVNIDPNSAEEMERKKERIMLLSLQRRQRADEARQRADAAAAARRNRDLHEKELKAARREEQARRREAILHQYKLKKAIEEAEREGKVIDKSELVEATRPSPGAGGGRTRRAAPRARPKTIHVDSGSLHQAEGLLHKLPSSTNLTAAGGTMRRDYYRGSQDSLAERAGLYRGPRNGVYKYSPVEERGGMSPSSASSAPLGRRGSCKTSRERVNEEPQSARGRSKYSSYQSNFKAGRKSSSLMNLCDSGLGRATPPRRAASPGVRGLGSPGGGGGGGASGPGSLPGAIGKRRTHDDNSDVSSTHSSIMDYSGPRLYKQPTTKSNRGIMLNAVEYCVFPGAVNAEAKRRVLEEIARSESKHFLVLFRDAGCQFRALYSYCPDTDLVAKLYGTGPKHVNDRMFDKFFKYNSGSKCFSQVHTKHLTVTIDAFTIHNSLWQGKKVTLPSKRDMALVI